MTAGVHHLDLGAKKDPAATFVVPTVRVLAKPQTEIHIFEPERKEPFVETSAALKTRAPDQQARARGLLHLSGAIMVEIEVPVPAVQRIIREQPVQQKHFKDQVDGTRK